MFLETIGTGKNRKYKHVCYHCNDVYYSKYKDGKYCKNCMDKKLFLVGKKRPENIGKKISQSKLKFFQTEKGKEVAKQVGKKNAINTKLFNNSDYGKVVRKKAISKQSKTMKRKIANGEFTPPITNTFTHWDAFIDDKKFRSSWEACFWYSNQHLLYESKECRTKIQSNDRVYVGDFFDVENKILYEIKPKSFFLKQSKKIDSLINHCKENNYKFVWINEFNIMDYIKSEEFSGSNLIQLNKLKEGIGYARNKD